jgi:glycosyltransferase involved in cell wall biosynthesis
VPNWNKGIKAFRMFLYRIPALQKIFTLQDADFYYVRMRSFIHLIPYLVAKKRRKKFIQAIASDIDVLSERKKFHYLYKSDFSLSKFLTESLPSDLVFKYLLRKSDFVMLQHVGQKFRSTSFKNNQVIFSNIIDLHSLPVNKTPSKDYFLYVGSLTILKGADRLLELINIVNNSVLILIIGLPKGRQSTAIYEQLGKKKNVFLIGRKDHNETLKYISNAKALINTSYYEGFPNIYLEAWGMGVPVISLTVNPGGVFNNYELGICCNSDLYRMKFCMESNELNYINPDALTAYVERFHNFENAAERFLKMITP